MPSVAVSLPPSRDANPFATCWTRPGALPWSLGDAVDPQQVVARLERSGWRGQVVGPHGSGKTSLLRTLRTPIERAGYTVDWVDALRATADPSPIASTGSVVRFIEGFERLDAAARRRCLARSRREGVGVLVTTHRRRFEGMRPLAVVARMAPTERSLAELFARLTADRVTQVTLDDARESFARRGGNLREVWFDLYNRHETLVRDGRTRRPTPS